MWYTLTNKYGVHMTFILSTVYLLGTGCSSNADPVSTTTTNTPVAVPTPTADSSAKKSSEGLPNLKSISKEGCDNGPGVMGAASYFVGELKITDGMVRGEEEWILFANKNGLQPMVETVRCDGHYRVPKRV